MRGGDHVVYHARAEREWQSDTDALTEDSGEVFRHAVAGTMTENVDLARANQTLGAAFEDRAIETGGGFTDQVRVAPGDPFDKVRFVHQRAARPQDGEQSARQALAVPGVDLAGLEVAAGPTFRWTATHDFVRWVTSEETSSPGVSAGMRPVRQLPCGRTRRTGRGIPREGR